MSLTRILSLLLNVFLVLQESNKVKGDLEQQILGKRKVFYHSSLVHLAQALSTRFLQNANDCVFPSTRFVGFNNKPYEQFLVK